MPYRYPPEFRRRVLDLLRLREIVGFGCAGARCGVMLRGFRGLRSCRSW